MRSDAYPESRGREVPVEGLHTLRVETGGAQSVRALHLECVPLWLAGLELGRVKGVGRTRGNRWPLSIVPGFIIMHPSISKLGVC